MKYGIHDNGGIPFVVHVTKKTKVEVINNEGELVFSTENALRVLPGNAKKKADKGNTVLIELPDNKYVYIGGRHIKQFSLIKGDRILRYESPLGNNDVSYPFAIGREYVYYMEAQEDYRKRKGPQRRATWGKVMAVVYRDAVRNMKDPYRYLYDDEFSHGELRTVRTKLLHHERV